MIGLALIVEGLFMFILPSIIKYVLVHESGTSTTFPVKEYESANCPHKVSLA